MPLSSYHTCMLLISTPKRYNMPARIGPMRYLKLKIWPYLVREISKDGCNYHPQIWKIKNKRSRNDSEQFAFIIDLVFII